MKILLTGGGGYIGTRLSQLLLSKGDEVTILDDFRFGESPALPAIIDGATVVRGDVRDRELLRGLASSCDAVVHLAAIVGYPACAADPHEARSVNVDGARSVSEAVRAGTRFIYASTGSVYGKLDSTCTETSPTNAVSLYGQTMLEGESIAVARGAIALRFATVYGVSPAMRTALLPNLLTIEAVQTHTLRLYEPHSRRTFMHIDDACDAYVHTINSADVVPGVYNVGDPALSMTKAELAAEISSVVGDVSVTSMTGSDLDQRDYSVDYSKFTATGFACRIPIRDGLEQVMRLAKILPIAPTERVDTIRSLGGARASDWVR